MRSLSAAAARATAGQTIVLAAGTYEGGVEFQPGVAVVGLSQAAVSIKSPTATGLRMRGPGSLTLTDLTVVDAESIGISAETVSVTLRRVRVTGTTKLSKTGGHGVQVVAAPSVRLEDCQIDNNAGVGLAAFDCGPVVVTDTKHTASPRVVGAASESVNPAFTAISRIAANLGGGISVARTDASPFAFAPFDVTVTGTDLDGNGLAALLLVKSSGDVVRSALRRTIKTDSGGPGDGVVIDSSSEKAPRHVQLRLDAATLVAENQRTGVLVAGDCEAQIDAGVAANAWFGVSVQGAKAHARLSAQAHIAKNGFAGVSVTAGARLDATGTSVTDTIAKLWKSPETGQGQYLADGIVFGYKTTGSLKGVFFLGNARVALYLARCQATGAGLPDVTVNGCTFSEGMYGVALIGKFAADALASITAPTSGNTFAGVKLPTYQTETDGEIQQFKP